MKLCAALGSCDALLSLRERTDRNVISVRISKRELLGVSVRIYVWLLFEPSDERARPLGKQRSPPPRRLDAHNREGRVAHQSVGQVPQAANCTGLGPPDNQRVGAA